VVEVELIVGAAHFALAFVTYPDLLLHR
jgi:hypothetical protein